MKEQEVRLPEDKDIEEYIYLRNQKILLEAQLESVIKRLKELEDKRAQDNIKGV